MDGDLRTLRALYDALAQRDGEAMAACYAPDARFTDPVFRDLRGPQVGAMWRMLCSRARDLKVQVRRVEAEEGFGAASWEARYTFGATGRSVHNVIHSRFALRDGLITQHTDTFDFHAWASQALGWKGKAFGWTRPLHENVKQQAMVGLERYMQDEAAERMATMTP